MNLSPLPIQKFFDNAGRPLNGGLLFTYVPATTTKLATYQDQAGTLNANPIVLNFRGEANVWLDQTLTYKFVLAPEGDTDPPTRPFWSVDNISAGVTFASLTAQIIGLILYPRTQAEINALVVPTYSFYPPFNLLRYGADPTGIVAANTAMASAIAVCGTIGGTIVVPPGVYLFTGNSNAINLAAKGGITIQGDGAQTAGAQPAVRFNFSGTGTGVLINMNAAYGCSLKGIQVLHTSASFTGTYLQINHAGAADPQGCGAYDCTFGNPVGAGTTHIDLDGCINFSAERCSFFSGNPSIKGRKVAGFNYSNVIAFRDCQWFQNPVVPIHDPGEAWSFERCTFEPLTTGAPGAVLSNSSSAPCNGISFRSCWFGDATATAGTWLELRGAGLAFHGNEMAGSVVGTTGITLRQFNGASIEGNSFGLMLKGIDFATATCGQIVVKGNLFNTVTTAFTNDANVQLGTFDWGPNFGVNTPTNHAAINQNGFKADPQSVTVEQWGLTTVTTNVATAIVFPKAFPTNCFNVQCTISTAPGGQNLAATLLTTTQFTLTVGGTAGVNTVFWRALGN